MAFSLVFLFIFHTSTAALRHTARSFGIGPNVAILLTNGKSSALRDFKLTKAGIDMETFVKTTREIVEI